MLVAGSENPDHLLASGSDLLSLQPSLLRLKDGLIDAQIRSSELAANRTEDHPALQNAKATELEIRTRMRDEARVAVRAMQPTLAQENERVLRLKERRDQLTSRLEALAAARTDYANVDAEVDHRTTLLETAEQALTEAQASRNAALSTNLVAELGPPQVSENPIGPGGTLVTLGSASAGLLFGLGTAKDGAGAIIYSEEDAAKATKLALLPSQQWLRRSSQSIDEPPGKRAIGSVSPPQEPDGTMTHREA